MIAAPIKIELTIQTVARPHKVLLKKKMLVPTYEAIEAIKKSMIEDYNRQYPGGEPLEVLDKIYGRRG